jgi:hypothetical protein
MKVNAAQAGGIIRVPSARSYNADRAGLVVGVGYPAQLGCWVWVLFVPVGKDSWRSSI